MKTWTVAQIRAKRPCSRYPAARIEQLWAGKKALSLLEILSLDIPAKDRMWVVWLRGAITLDQQEAILDKIFSREAIIDFTHRNIEAIERDAQAECEFQVQDVVSVLRQEATHDDQ